MLILLVIVEEIRDDFCFFKSWICFCFLVIDILSFVVILFKYEVICICLFNEGIIIFILVNFFLLILGIVILLDLRIVNDVN